MHYQKDLEKGGIPSEWSIFTLGEQNGKAKKVIAGITNIVYSDSGGDSSVDENELQWN